MKVEKPRVLKAGDWVKIDSDQQLVVCDISDPDCLGALPESFSIDYGEGTISFPEGFLRSGFFSVKWPKSVWDDGGEPPVEMRRNRDEQFIAQTFTIKN